MTKLLFLTYYKSFVGQTRNSKNSDTMAVETVTQTLSSGLNVVPHSLNLNAKIVEFLNENGYMISLPWYRTPGAETQSITVQSGALNNVEINIQAW